jgi:hypothetical protein
MIQSWKDGCRVMYIVYPVLKEWTCSSPQPDFSLTFRWVQGKIPDTFEE